MHIVYAYSRTVKHNRKSSCGVLALIKKRECALRMRQRATNRGGGAAVFADAKSLFAGDTRTGSSETRPGLSETSTIISFLLQNTV